MSIPRKCIELWVLTIGRHTLLVALPPPAPEPYLWTEGEHALLQLLLGLTFWSDVHLLAQQLLAFFLWLAACKSDNVYI